MAVALHCEEKLDLTDIKLIFYHIMTVRRCVAVNASFGGLKHTNCYSKKNRLHLQGKTQSYFNMLLQ